MKIFCSGLLFLLFPLCSLAQASSNFYLEGSNMDDARVVMSVPEIEQPLTPITFQQGNGLSAVYLVTEKNKSISSSYIPTSTYRYRHPANKDLNCYIASANTDFSKRDSFNPFGARSFEEAMVLGVMNTVFSKIMKNIQRPKR